MKTDYDTFIQTKSRRATQCGFEPLPILTPLFDWQAHVVKWAVQNGCSALFEDCGLGKTIQQLEWASQVHRHTGSSVLILTPLAVAHQTAKEAQRFGLNARVANEESDITESGIWITNYEKLEKFDCSQFAGVVLDESSILKNFTGKMRRLLTDTFADTPYRLCCTATPSPNDYTEFGQHADFLGVCSPAQMLATFFINDTFNTGDWRLKKHAEKEFWAWVASWAACISKPSDIGYDDGGYNLPSLNLQNLTVHVDQSINPAEGELFRNATMSATTMHQEMRMTSSARANKVAEIVNSSNDDFIIWCNTNDESQKLASLIPDAIEVIGADHADYKEMAIDWFKHEICSCLTGKFRYKFPAWQKQDISANTIKKIKRSDLSNQSNGSSKINSGVKNTCSSITLKKKKDGIKEQGSSATKSTKQGVKNMLKMSNTENLLKQKSSNGIANVQSEEKNKDLKNTESQSSNTNQSLKNKREDVQYVDIQTQAKNQSFHLSIIATPLERSGGSYAPLATLPSDNLKTIQCSCGKLQNTSRRVLISKVSMFGFGLNLQHCSNVAFVGLSYSFEDFYQALRRSYRFGQKKEVNAYIVTASTEHRVIKSINKKIEQHKNMQEKMKIAATEFIKNQTKPLTMKTDIDTVTTENFTMHHGDCVRVAKTIPDNSIDFCVFSPPFADLFTYSDDLQDMGNCSDMSEFTKHFELLIAELGRIMTPGREVAVHCLDLLSTKWKTGKIEFTDFSGEIIRAFWRHGFLFHSRITIWKSPVTEMQRTKAHGLLHKTLCTDSSSSRVGAPDYLLVFRKEGESAKPVVKDRSKYPVDWWQEVASPVWMTVDQGRVLNRDGARDNNDERHICPLQLDVIERAIELWSNEGDTVYSPFTGIGSEGVGALSLDRKFIGSELKESYFKQACENLKNAKAQLTLF